METAAIALVSTSLHVGRIRAVAWRSRISFFAVLVMALPLTGLAQAKVSGRAQTLRLPDLTSELGNPALRVPIPVTEPGHGRAFRIPKLKGMNLFPARSITEHRIEVYPSWLHFHIHCAIDHGNMYIDGKVTNNSGQPVPGMVVYIWHDGTPIMQLTSNLSGGYHGVVPLTAGAIAAPWDPALTPFSCVAPDVKVGTPADVRPNVRLANSATSGD